MFDMPWVQLCWPNAVVEPGATVAVLISHLGFWSLNACRVVYVVDEHGSSEKYGFAYGTLPDHGEREERFTVTSIRTNRFGTTYMRFRGPTSSGDWPIRTLDRCRNALPKTRKPRCRGSFRRAWMSELASTD
jgi:hypothetical protein